MTSGKVCGNIFERPKKRVYGKCGIKREAGGPGWTLKIKQRQTNKDPERFFEKSGIKKRKCVSIEVRLSQKTYLNKVLTRKR